MTPFVRYTATLFFYRLSLLFLLPVVLLLMVIRSRGHSAYRHRLLERLGVKLPQIKAGGIVIHAASVGEVIAIKAFVEGLIKVQPELPITITTFTPTGSEQVKKMFDNKVQHCYFPLDCFPCTWLFLKKLKPKAVVLMETELWPNFIAHCKARHIRLLLINGRLSDKSMKSYQKLHWLITPCLRRFDKILTQSSDNQANFLKLGAEKSACHISGNLKFDLQIDPALSQKQALLSQFISDERDVWLVASTHEGDEAIALASFEQLQQSNPNLLLILVPRHPERFDSVYQLCQKQFNTVKRSEETKITADKSVWLIDTLGELLALCSVADIVTMGGSFSNIGGHNPLEPALFKKAVVVGHDMSNFRKVMEQLSLHSGVVQLDTNIESTMDEVANQLSVHIKELLENKNLRGELGNNAYQVVHENQGASEKSVKALMELI